MAGWDWLSKPAQGYSWRFVLRVLVKAGVLFAVLNVLFALLMPLPALGQLSLYNGPLPGRLRLPYGEDAARSYNLSLNSLDAMFAAHVIDAASDDEFRVLVLGDSSTWGFLLPPEQTLTAHLNALGLTTPDGQRMRFYNLGYPIMSL
ncbi:MAG: hypothetical protein JW910_20370, partial [Anaerolineae bacterium]|nr:hypothetical protein [Anaerolineae bacterium]